MCHDQARPRLCLALPGLNNLPYSPRALSTRPLVPFLQQAFDVTVVFRRVLSTDGLEGLRCLEIEPGRHPMPVEPQHALSYFQPRGPEAMRYVDITLPAFSGRYAVRFDVIIEREWAWLGALGDAFQAHGVPAILHTVSEFRGEQVRRLNMRRPWRVVSAWRDERRRLRGLGEAAAVVTESVQSARVLSAKVAGLSPHPVPLGVDRDLFHPLDRRDCRARLGWDDEDVVVLYVGSLNR